MLTDITPVVLTRDEAPNISRCLEALRWAAEVVVVDSYSTDSTPGIARAFPNVRFLQREFDTLANQWAYGMDTAGTEWVLALDADHIVTPDVVAEITSLHPDPDLACYVASFDYVVAGRKLRGSLYPPKKVLLRRSRCAFWQDGHTQRVRHDGTIGRLVASLAHDDRKPFRRFVQRQKSYMALEAAKIRSASFRSLNPAGRIRKLILFAPPAVVIHTLFIRGLIFDGWPGLIYTWERFLAETMLSIELIRGRR